jgi:hypothetical protein
MLEIMLTDHSRKRAAQRGLSLPGIYYIICNGQRMRRSGAVIYYLAEKDIPADDRKDDRWAKLCGSAVILAKDGHTLMTVWRNRKKGLKHIRRKPPFFQCDRGGE